MAGGTNNQTPLSRIPANPSALRQLIPKLGLRNYWYPALRVASVPFRKPVKRRLLGETICFFRGERGQVVALADACPHRGGSLGNGDCHFPGTVACPYHGWVYDERGTNVAVLSEGPGSSVCGKKGTEAQVYPTREFKGVVFIWIGSEAPAPIEEDVPEEFFDPAAAIFINDRIIWKCDWAMSLENALDSHVNYVHRNNVKAVLSSPGYWRRGATGARPTLHENGVSGVLPPDSPIQDIYANGWRWPKRRYRLLWTWLFGPLFRLLDVPAKKPPSEYWGGGHRLPSMFRLIHANLFGLYTRWNVPIEQDLTRVWYFHAVPAKNWLARAWYWMLYWGLYRWLTEYDFSQQDLAGTNDQRWDLPEKLSGTDAELILWRRLLVTKHLGGRKAKLPGKGPGAPERTREDGPPEPSRATPGGPESLP